MDRVQTPSKSEHHTPQSEHYTICMYYYFIHSLFFISMLVILLLHLRFLCSITALSTFSRSISFASSFCPSASWAAHWCVVPRRPRAALLRVEQCFRPCRTVLEHDRKVLAGNMQLNGETWEWGREETRWDKLQNGFAPEIGRNTLPGTVQQMQYGKCSIVSRDERANTGNVFSVGCCM
jgi:hypothetical protein